MKRTAQKDWTAASGTWLYDGAIPMRIDVTASNYDRDFVLWESLGMLDDGEEAEEPSPAGTYYYVSSSGPFKSLSAAKEWANQNWGPIDWDV